MPIPDEFKDTFIINVRWTLYKNFLEERGKDYRQVLIADTRDVIFQGDVFEKYADTPKFLGYTTEGELIKNCQINYKWIKNSFGKDEADKLSDCEIICAGTVLGTVNEIKYFAQKMELTINNRNSSLYMDQGIENYLVRENLLDIENIVEINCQHGNIITAGYFFDKNTINIVDNKILRGDGGIPAVVHQYDRQPSLIQLVNNLYRDKNFQPNENYNDNRSMFEQIFHLMTLGRIDDAYKLFAKHLHGRNLVGYADNLINLWNLTLQRNITPTSELLIMSIQNSLMSTGGNGFHLGHINQIFSLTNFCLKNHLVVSYPFKIFVGNILFNVANHLHDAKQFEPCISCLNFMAELEIPLDQNYYLFKAKVCRESGKKSEALAAYEKALNI